MIRYFLLEGTKQTTASAVAKIDVWINRYPRKMLKYQPPLQMFRGG
ncbi:MAG TPA: hypothetical protein VGC17_02835 [Lactovum miscens]